MDIYVEPKQLKGSIAAIPSKSVAHRALICAALANRPTKLLCPTTSVDIDTTISCLETLGVRIERCSGGMLVHPIPSTYRHSKLHIASPLDCMESGSTLRFMLPLVGALGAEACFVGRGRLSKRPLSPLYEEMLAAGCDLSEQGSFPLYISGKLRAGQFELPGDVSSQYITGLLLAAPAMDGETRIRVMNPIQSMPYISITKSVMKSFGVEVIEASECSEHETEGFTTFIVPADAHYESPESFEIEGDWSNAAFWLAAGAVSDAPLQVTGLNLLSSQGDRSILAALARLGARITRRGNTASAQRDHLQGAEIDVRDFPDLVPPLAVVAALAEGTSRFTHAERLRLKESDRLASVSSCINALGGRARVEGNDLIIEGVDTFTGGIVDSAADHRICMQAAIAATLATDTVTIQGAQCVEKSYPNFFDDFSLLGGVVREGS